MTGMGADAGRKVIRQGLYNMILGDQFSSSPEGAAAIGSPCRLLDAQSPQTSR